MCRNVSVESSPNEITRAFDRHERDNLPEKLSTVTPFNLLRNKIGRQLARQISIFSDLAFNEGEAGVDLVMTQPSPLFFC